MWLALGHQACGDDAEALAIYKALESTHPSRKVRQQAANLRFILEAPKLTLSEEEKVKLPVLSDIDRNRRRAPGLPVRRPPVKQATRKRELTWEEKAWEEYELPSWTTNRYVLVASTILAVGLIFWGNALKS